MSINKPKSKDVSQTRVHFELLDQELVNMLDEFREETRQSKSALIRLLLFRFFDARKKGQLKMSVKLY